MLKLDLYTCTCMMQQACELATCGSVSSEVRASDAGYMKGFVRHGDAQMVLSKLQLPFISTADHAGALTQTAAIAVDDDDDSVGVDGAPRNHDTGDHEPRRRPLAPIDMIADLVLVEAGGVRNRQGHDTFHVYDDQDREITCDSQSLQVASVFHNDAGSGSGARRFPLKKLKSMEQKDYENMTHAQCALVASKASKALAAQSNRADEAMKQLKALKRLNKAQEATAQKKQRTDAAKQGSTCLEIVPVGKAGTRITTQSFLAVGIRRNMSNIAASDFGATVMYDLSHQRVCRAEVRTCAAVLSKMRGWCSAAVETITGNTRPWGLITVIFRCDATNSSIWKRENLHVLDVDVAYIHDHDAIGSFDADKAIRCERCLLLPQLNSTDSHVLHVLTCVKE